MRLVVQRASAARVEVDGEVVGALPRPGLLVLVGVLMVTGIWTLWIYQLQNLAGTFTTPV